MFAGLLVFAFAGCFAFTVLLVVYLVWAWALLLFVNSVGVMVLLHICPDLCLRGCFVVSYVCCYGMVGIDRMFICC